MQVAIPKRCHKMVAAYKHLGYRLVPSDREGLIKMQRKGKVPIIYIIAYAKDKHGNKVSHPFTGVSLLNRSRSKA